MGPDFGLHAREVEVAVEAVRQAARLCLAIEASSPKEAWLKDDRSPVTLADLASQALVASRLEAVFPSDPVVAEEDASRLRAASQAELLRILQQHIIPFAGEADGKTLLRWIDRGGGKPAARFWTLDPVDGTKGLLRGGQYAVALALIERGGVDVAALACPHLDLGWGEGSVFLAARGWGAWAAPLAEGEWVRLRVSRRAAPSQARLLRSVEPTHTDADRLDRIVSLMGARPRPVRMDSQAKYALVAAGRADLVVRLVAPSRPDYCERIWDHAAGSLLVEEAGGMVTDLRGEALDFSQGREMRANLGVLASNGRLHVAAQEAIRAAGADRRPEGGSA